GALEPRTDPSHGITAEVAAARVADVQLRILEGEQRLTSLGEELRELAKEHVEVDELRAALLSFEPVWDSLETKERARVLQLLVEVVVLDGTSNKLAITF